VVSHTQNLLRPSPILVMSWDSSILASTHGSGQARKAPFQNIRSQWTSQKCASGRLLHTHTHKYTHAHTHTHTHIDSNCCVKSFITRPLCPTGISMKFHDPPSVIRKYWAQEVEKACYRFPVVAASANPLLTLYPSRSSYSSYTHSPSSFTIHTPLFLHYTPLPPPPPPSSSPTVHCAL
jgi:hypothetical protein